MIKKICYANMNQNKTSVAFLISDKIELNDKEQQGKKIYSS